MRKRIQYLILVGMLTLLCACGQAEEPSSEIQREQFAASQESEEAGQEASGEIYDDIYENGETVFPYTFTDDCGREVTVTDCGRVAAMIGSFADIWMSAGGEVIACADDGWSSLGLPLAEGVTNLGGTMEPNLELLIASKPDFVLASAKLSSNLEMQELLENAGICVAYFEVSNFDQYLHMLDICTDLTGRKELFAEKGTKVQREITEIRGRADGSAPRVLVLRTATNTVRAMDSTATVCSEILADLGCINIADGGILSGELSLEAIVTEDPEYIFVVFHGTDDQASMAKVESVLTSNPVWESLSAVKNGRFYIMDRKLFHLKPNERWAEAYRIAADILYPES